jgi:RNA polymerase sigma-70 factor (ECF subfamily)
LSERSFSVTSDPHRTLERFYRHHSGAVYRYALSLVGDREEAEDIAQTTFLNAYGALQRGERVRQPLSWLLTIAHNAVLNRVDQRRRRPREVPLQPNLPALVAGPDERPDLGAVLNAVAELPVNQRRALVLHEVEGLRYREIAATLDVTVPAVESLLGRARRTLARRKHALRTLVPLPLSNVLRLGAGSGAGGVGDALGVKSATFVAAAAAVAGAAAIGTVHGSSAPARSPGPALPEPAVVAAAAASPATKPAAHIRRTQLQDASVRQARALKRPRAQVTTPLTQTPAPVSRTAPASTPSAVAAPSSTDGARQAPVEAAAPSTEQPAAATVTATTTAATSAGTSTTAEPAVAAVTATVTDSTASAAPVETTTGTAAGAVDTTTSTAAGAVDTVGATGGDAAASAVGTAGATASGAVNTVTSAATPTVTSVTTSIPQPAVPGALSP